MSTEDYGPVEPKQYAPPWVSIYSAGTDGEQVTIVFDGVEVHLPGKWSRFQANLLFQALRPAQDAVRDNGPSLPEEGSE